jgi:hypothetical protein
VCSTPHLVPGKAQLEPDNRYVIISFHYFMKFTSYFVEIHPEDSLATVQHKKLSDIDLLIDSIYSNKIFSTKKGLFQISEYRKRAKVKEKDRGLGVMDSTTRTKTSLKPFFGGITVLSSNRRNQESSAYMMM